MGYNKEYGSESRPRETLVSGKKQVGYAKFEKVSIESRHTVQVEPWFTRMHCVIVLGINGTGKVGHQREALASRFGIAVEVYSTE